MNLDDLVEILYDGLSASSTTAKDFKAAPEPERQGKWGFHVGTPYNRPFTTLRAGRLFLSEHDIRRMLKDGRRTLHVPRRAIVSPLAQEWLTEKGIAILYE